MIPNPRHLEEAENHVREGEERIAKLEARIAELVADGHTDAAKVAKELLQVLERSQELAREHLRIERALNTPKQGL